jgi:hypothetical protein
MDRLRDFRAATLSCLPNLLSAINGSIFLYRMRVRARLRPKEPDHELR